MQHAGFDWSIDVMGFSATRRNSRPERTIAQGTAREQGLRQLLRQLREAMRRGIRIPVETTVNELRRFVLLGMNTTVSTYNVHLGYRPHVAFDPELVQMGGRTQRVAFAGRRASRARGIPGWRHVYYLRDVDDPMAGIANAERIARKINTLANPNLSQGQRADITVGDVTSGEAYITNVLNGRIDIGDVRFSNATFNPEAYMASQMLFFGQLTNFLASAQLLSVMDRIPDGNVGGGTPMSIID